MLNRAGQAPHNQSTAPQCYPKWRRGTGLRSQTNSNRTLARQNTVKIINIILPVNGSAAGAVFDRDVEPGT